MLNWLKQIAWGALFGTLIATQAFGQATLAPNAVQQYFNAQGVPVASGTVDYYIPNTTTRKTTWSSSTESVGTQNPNPVLLNSGGYPQNGSGQISGTYIDGSYRQVVKDQDGNLIWDAVTASTGSGGGGGSTPTIGDGLSVGTVISYTGVSPPLNYLFAAGQPISRTTYSALFTAETFSLTISCQATIATISVSATISSLVPIGAPIEASCFPPGTLVSSKTSGLLTLSNPANITLSVPAIIFPWGNGDGATTFNLPDLRGRTFVGADNMGSTGGGAGVLTNTWYGSNPDALAAYGGQQFLVLQASQIPSINSAGANLITVAPGGGGTGIPLTSAPGNISDALVSTSSGTVNVPASSSGSWAGLTSLTGTNTISVTSNNTGSTGTPTIQPSVTTNYIIKVFPDTSVSIATIGQLQPGTPNQLAGTSGTGVFGTVTVPTGLTVASNALNFNIPGLTAQPSPNANNDYTLIYNAACNCTEKVSLAQIATSATAGVTTYNGLAGAVGGVNIQSSSYTITNTDCEKTVYMNGGSSLLQASLPSTSGFPSNCKITLKDGSSGRGVQLSGFPTGLTSPNILWPLQALVVQNVSGTWVLLHNPGRWVNANTVFFVDTGGSGGADGLGTGSGALQSLNQCRAYAQAYVDTQAQGNGGITCLVTAGQTFQEFVQVFYPLVGGGSLIFQGNGGQFNWVPANSSYALQFGDLGVAAAVDVNFTTTGSTSPAGLIAGHNYGVLDLRTNVTFTASSPAITTAMSCDFDAHFNINNGFNYIGTFTTTLWQTCSGSVWDFNGAQNNTGTTSLGRYFIQQTSSKVTLEGNVSFSSGALTTSAGLLTGNSVLNNLSGSAPPGGAPTPATGAQYCTTQC